MLSTTVKYNAGIVRASNHSKEIKCDNSNHRSSLDQLSRLRRQATSQFTMAFRHQGSRTLPKNFTFSSAHARDPRTPERPSIPLDFPPPPRHSSARLSRSRVRQGTELLFSARTVHESSNYNFADIPLPSIEVPPQRDVPMSRSYTSMTPIDDDRFLAPPRGRQAFRTPPAQIRPMSVDPRDIWHHQSFGSPVRRRGSVCSNASDSSISSIETFASAQSVGDSCTSPDSDIHDPFFYPDRHRKQISEPPPPMPLPRKRPFKALLQRGLWTPEMDNHLWNTYQLYLQDPTITPFKMTPGSIPPLGVTHRVARQAKKSWEKRRPKTGRACLFEESKAELKEPIDVCRCATPTPTTNPPKSHWPNSYASTRRRLKLLCKRKFSIAPHYQRMLQSRSPSPFLDVFSRPYHEVPYADSCDSTAYATRDLGVSLVSSMVPGTLSQLATESLPSDDWFNTPVQSAQHDAVVESVPKDSVALGEADSIPRLGSPFIYRTWGPRSSKREVEQQLPRPRRGTIHITGSRLQSPPRIGVYADTSSDFTEGHLHAEVGLSKNNDAQPPLEELLRQGKFDGVGQGCMRIRNRGATTSSVKSLDQNFSPPPPCPIAEKSTSAPVWNIRGENIKRLGSPFQVEGTPRSKSSGRFIRHAPSLSEPFAGLSANLMANREPIRPQDREAISALPYDPTEEGISEAERIRRQALNMPYTRK